MRAARFIGRLLVVQLLAHQLVALHTYDFCPNECGVESGYGICEVRFLVVSEVAFDSTDSSIRLRCHGRDITMHDFENVRPSNA